MTLLALRLLWGLIVKMKNKYDYCSYSPDSVDKVYFGDCCKIHDINYSFEGKIKRNKADFILMKGIYLKFRKKQKIFMGITISIFYYLAVRLFGKKYWKKRSIKNLKRYK